MRDVAPPRDQLFLDQMPQEMEAMGVGHLVRVLGGASPPETEVEGERVIGPFSGREWMEP